MPTILENDVLAVQAERYKLQFPKDRPFVKVYDACDRLLMELFPYSSIHTLGDRDDTVRTDSWQAETTESGDVVVSITAYSSLWEKKVIRFRCGSQRFTYEIEIHGKGKLAEAVYFGGYYSAVVRWGSGFLWSGQSFRRGWNPEPNGQEENYFDPAGGAVIDIVGVPLPGKGDWFFTPPPFCFAFEGADEWVTMGVESKAGGNRFTEFSYIGQQQFGFHLALNYEGHTDVNGVYELPAIGFDFAENEYAALNKHTDVLRNQGFVPVSEKARPEWWFEPIFCGWGSQCYLASVDQGHAPSYARQELYDQFMESLDRGGVTPGIVVLDDKWQASYGENIVDTEKWPNLRGFIDRQHEEGKKVLLWLKAWDPEGLPAEECITNAAGLPIAFDPSNPAFEKRLRESVLRMLSNTEGAYDADGFKIDFSARIPSGPGIRLHGDIWGLELMKLYLFILYDEAKKAKPDALIMSHTPHPYLADVVDMIRLNDINTGKPVNRAMSHRAKVAEAALPNAVIDTDNWPIVDKATWREYVRLQPELGVPSLYYASHIDSTKEPLTEEDYALIREAWARARELRSSRN